MLRGWLVLVCYAFAHLVLMAAHHFHMDVALAFAPAFARCVSCVRCCCASSHAFAIDGCSSSILHL